MKGFRMKSLRTDASDFKGIFAEIGDDADFLA